jgi:phasin
MLGLDEDGVSPRHPRRSDVRQRATGGEASKEKALQVRQPKKQRAKSRTSIMAEATTTTTPPKVKSKPAASAFEMPKFEMPKFEMPKFEIPKVEMPAAFREFAERGVAQCKDTYEKMKAAAEEATDVLETTYSTASKGTSEYGLKVIEAARMNTNAAFDFFGELITAKSLSEVIELSSAHTRKQFETLTEQSKELGALVQKVATETAEPIKSGMNKAFSKVA